MALFAEIKRRNVFKVGAAYLAVAWLLIQIGVSIEGPLLLPGWFDTTIILLLGFGFPVALFLAWAYELTPEGVRPSRAVDAVTSGSKPTGQRLNLVIISALSMAVVFLAVDNYLLDGDEEAAMPPASSNLPGTTTASIAILPFEEYSDNERSVDFAEGVYIEIFNQLDRLGRLDVIDRRSMKRFEGSRQTYEEIAAETNANFVLELLVRSPDDSTVRIDAQLWQVQGPTAAQIWQEQYDRQYTTGDFFEIQASIARNISQRLNRELSPVEEARLSESMTENAEALSYYFSALPYSDDGTAENAEKCLDPIARAVEFDPGFKEAWYRKGICHGIRSSFYFPVARQERQQAREAFEQALAIDDGYAEAELYLAQSLGADSNWHDAADAYQRALALGGQSLLGPDVNFLFSVAIGHLESALAAVESEFDRDVQAVGQVSMSVRVELFESLGDRDSSDAAFQLGQSRFAAWDLGKFARLLVLMGRARSGDIDRDEVTRYYSDGWRAQSEWHTGLVDIFENRETVVPYLQAELEISGDNPFKLLDLAANFAYRGEPELALAAMKNSLPSFGLNILHIWMPLFRDVRQLEAFRDHMREIGMVDVWQALGWPYLCEPMGRDDFRCN